MEIGLALSSVRGGVGLGPVLRVPGGRPTFACRCVVLCCGRGSALRVPGGGHYHALCLSCRAYFSGCINSAEVFWGSLVPSWLHSDVAGMIGSLCHVPRRSKLAMIGGDAELVEFQGKLLVSCTFFASVVPVSLQPQVFERVWTTLRGFLSLASLAHQVF